MAEEVQTIKKNKNGKKDYIFAVGRRKSSVARVRLYEHVKADVVWAEMPIKKGELYVNQKPIAEYFSGEVSRRLYTEPLRVTNTHQQNYTFTIKVAGGGPSGQLQAVVVGIASALNTLDPEKHRVTLKKKGFLTRDSRVRERRAVGMGGKSRRKKQSPKR
ncbi:MAG TPA: 30S ribosomal protein S9 [Candidatus Sulfotelmatobacter sp.]|jgi:small subunit ribosomal protein S9|nr:30S ribosomal protein S9 [Candidatus Sulfotelmatobacter sp.]